MTGPTHREYSVCFAFLVMMLFYKLGISHINYYMAFVIVLMTSKHGALFPDLDHNWENVHSKTVPNKIINMLIHITGGKHRSWQTHSIDICAYFTIFSYILPNMWYNLGKISEVNKEVAIIILLGFSSGWISHLYSDMLTSAGVRLFFFSKFKIKFVPKRIGKLKFNTGNEWEAFNYKTMKKVNVILALVSLTYPFILKGELQKLILIIQSKIG